MKLEWDKSLETGNADIDNQHKRLFAAISDLLEAYRNGKELQGMEKALMFMTAYTLSHFEDEEKLQQEHYYPEYISHKRMHEQFRDVIEELIKKLRRNGPSEDLLLEVYNVSHEWLIRHIKVEDLKIAQHIQESKA